jgi:hypothetical protein
MAKGFISSFQYSNTPVLQDQGIQGLLTRFNYLNIAYRPGLNGRLCISESMYLERL